MKTIRIFLCGDVMTGRGIDQILPYQNEPHIYESYVTDAREYIYLAEQKNGKIKYPVSMNYIWGDALTFWQELKPDVKIINLETTITKSQDYLPYKGIHYRMHPQNIDVLTSANIDICALANNHILDWGYQGLAETIATLKKVGIKFSGAGANIQEVLQPAIYKLALQKRVLVFSAGTESSGVPSNWAATKEKSGIYYLPDLSQNTLLSVTENIKKYKQPDDLIIFSIHWGSNWGYAVSPSFRSFAHGLIDLAEVNVVFGHSSHHPRPIEIYHNKPILYGCGDFFNDYEGISGYEEYRGDLALMYFLDFDANNLQFQKITLIPLQIKKFRLHRASMEDCKWILQTLNQSSTFALQFIRQNQHLIGVA